MAVMRTEASQESATKKSKNSERKDGLPAALAREFAEIQGILTPLREALFQDCAADAPGLWDLLASAKPEGSLELRPILFAAAFRLGPFPFSEAAPIALAFELLSTSTIVVDDVLDAADRRDGKPALHAACGTERAVLAAEILKAAASETFLATLRRWPALRNKVEAAQRFEVAYREVCRGQYLDLLYEGLEEVSEADYYRMIRWTTGLLLETSLTVGGLLAGLPRAEIGRLARLGEALGYLHQLRDDLADCRPDEFELGREPGEDLRQRKKRLPVIHCLQQGSRESRKLRRLFSRPAMSAVDVRQAIALLESAGSLHYVERAMDRFAVDARCVLDGLPPGRSQRCLAAIITFLAGPSRAGHPKTRRPP